MNERAKLQRKTAFAAALLLLVGLVTGGFVSAAMTGKVPADPHAALASHLNALLGSFWLFGVAFTLPWLRFSLTGCRRLVAVTFAANASNWLVTAGKAFWHVAGVDLTGDARNDIIFGLLTTLVVLPSLVAAAAWVYGLCGELKNVEH